MLAGKPEVIANAEGNRTTPSVVAINKKGDRLVGQVATSACDKRQRYYLWRETSDRRKFSDDEVQKDHDIMPYEIVKRLWRRGQDRRQRIYARRSVCNDPSKIKADARKPFWAKSHRSDYYRSCVLLMTRNVRQPKTLARLPVLKSNVLSTTDYSCTCVRARKPKKKRSRCSTSAAVRSTYLFWNWATACSRSSQHQR